MLLSFRFGFIEFRFRLPGLYLRFHVSCALSSILYLRSYTRPLLVSTPVARQFDKNLLPLGLGDVKMRHCPCGQMFNRCIQQFRKATNALLELAYLSLLRS